MKTKVEVSGLRELDAALHQLPRAAAKSTLRRVGKRALTPMAEQARSKAPDDPVTPAPDLHRSIAISSRQKSGRQIARLKEGKSSVNVFMGPTPDGYPQAMPQEFGSIHHPAQPFMRPAWDANKVRALEIVKSDLGKEIDKTAKRLAKRAARLAAKNGG